MEVVDVGIPRAGRTVGFNGRIESVASVVGKWHLNLGPIGRGECDSVDATEGCDVVRVAHDTNLEHRHIAGAAGFGPEAQL